MVGTLKLSQHVGCRIKFVTSDGAYEGDIKTVSDSCEKLILQNCVYLKDNFHVGTRVLFFKDISDLEVTSSKNRVIPRFEKSVLGNVRGDSSEMNIKDFTISPSFDHLPSRVFFIASYGEIFNLAMNDLKQSTVIGVSLEGFLIGRHGLNHWLGASSKSGTYFFDLQALGRGVFDRGLRDILQSSKIEKVIHDCRQVSDALCHLYNTKLAKVFDTQTADAFVNLQINSKKFRGNVNPLDSCLQTHLNISEDYLPQPVPCDIFYQRVKSAMLRPPSHLTMSIMVKNVIYLVRLMEEIKQKMLLPFTGACETYQNAVASRSDRYLKHNPHDPIKIPQDLLINDKFAAVEYKETPYKPISEEFNQAYTGEYSFVNKMNEFRRKNPHAEAKDLQSFVPKHFSRPKTSYYNYPEPVQPSFADGETFLGIRFSKSSNKLASQTRTSKAGESTVPEKKDLVLKTSGHPTSSASSQKVPFGAYLRRNPRKASAFYEMYKQKGLIPKTIDISSDGWATVVETSKLSSLVDSSEKDGSSKKAQELVNEKKSAPVVPLQPKCSNENISKGPTPEGKHSIPNTSRQQKEVKTTQNSGNVKQYEVNEYNTYVCNQDGTFSYPPTKKVYSYDPDNPWAAFKSKYPENDSVSSSLSLRPNRFRAG